MEEQISSTEKIFVVRKNAIKMIMKRGFVLQPQDDMTEYDAFVRRFGEDPNYEELSVMGVKLSDKRDRVIVSFNNSSSLGVIAIKQLVEHMKEEDIASAVIVVKNKISNYARQACKKFEPVFHLDLFSENELLVDITEHFLVPQHILLSEKEKTALLERLSIPADKLPKISIDDPICHYYGFKEGQVIKIIRNSLSGGRSVAFRVVM
ncbi:hypothetical protein WA577_004132 [Blastocystis sp. JDR]